MNPTEAAYIIVRRANETSLEDTISDYKYYSLVPSNHKLGIAMRSYRRYGAAHLNKVKHELDRELTSHFVIALINKKGTEQYPLESMEDLAKYCDPILN